MSFVCPVEDCTSVFEDWPSLQAHLAEAHEQMAVTKREYDSWRSSLGEQGSMSTSRSNSKSLGVSDNQSPDRESVEGLTEHIDEKLYTLRCPRCDKPFSRESEDAAFRSVRAHCQKVHRIRLKRADFGLPPEGGEGEEKPGEKAYEPGVSHPPDDLEMLYSELKRVARVKTAKAESICAYMESYPVDNLPRLSYILRKEIPEATRISFLEHWVALRGIDVDPRLAKELGLWLERGYAHRGATGNRGYGSTGYGGYYQQEDLMRETRLRDEERKRETDRAYQLGRLETMVEQLLEERRRLPRGDPQGDELKEKISLLESKLEDEKEMRHRQELASLREEFSLKLESFKKEEGSVLERQAVKAADRLGDISERMVTLGEKLIIGTAYRHNLLPEEAPVPRERQGPSGVASLIPLEYLDIERRVEEEVKG